GQFAPKCPGQFAPKQWVSLRRNGVVSFIIISNEVVLAVKSIVTQMSDAERLLLIHKASAGMQKNLNDLRQYNNNNVWLSLQRASDEQDKQAVKKLYGIN
nr:hypothetical protein [Mucilaginibacter sp. E4BP6]